MPCHSSAVFYQTLQKQIQGEVLYQEPLSHHTSMKVGGPADCFISPKNLTELQIIYTQAGLAGIPVMVIGAGTNLLISDQGIRGIVVSLKEGFAGYSREGLQLTVQSGLLLPKLIRISHQFGFTGLGFLAGIPGSVGGAVYMNAGTSSQFFSQVIRSGLVWDPVTQSIHPLTLDDFHFGYRTSILQKNSQVLLEVSLALLQGDIQAEQTFIRRINATRSRTQPLQFPNAGCTWKNPEKVTVGKIIEEAGLKGKIIGKAMVSTLHANFIVNLGGATFQDILALMELVEKTIYERYNIHLERELQIIA